MSSVRSWTRLNCRCGTRSSSLRGCAGARGCCCACIYGLHVCLSCLSVCLSVCLYCPLLRVCELSSNAAQSTSKSRHQCLRPFLRVRVHICPLYGSLRALASIAWQCNSPHALLFVLVCCCRLCLSSLVAEQRTPCTALCAWVLLPSVSV
jgi:hypothetical protein